MTNEEAKDKLTQYCNEMNIMSECKGDGCKNCFVTVAIRALDRHGEPTCSFCGGKLIWQSDYNYDEIYPEGEGVVSIWMCPNCEAEAQFSIRTDNPDE